MQIKFESCCSYLHCEVKKGGKIKQKRRAAHDCRSEAQTLLQLAMHSEFL